MIKLSKNLLLIKKKADNDNHKHVILILIWKKILKVFACTSNKSIKIEFSLNWSKYLSFSLIIYQIFIIKPIKVRLLSCIRLWESCRLVYRNINLQRILFKCYHLLLAVFIFKSIEFQMLFRRLQNKTHLQAYLISNRLD